VRKLKGLWFLGSGLFLLAVWVYLYWQFYFALLSRGATADNPFQIFLLSLYTATYSLFYPSVFTILPAMMFTLIATGLFRLVRSLFQSQWNDEEEE
jgi:hypothetical protein